MSSDSVCDDSGVLRQTAPPAAASFLTIVNCCESPAVNVAGLVNELSDFSDFAKGLLFNGGVFSRFCILSISFDDGGETDTVDELGDNCAIIRSNSLENNCFFV